MARNTVGDAHSSRFPDGFRILKGRQEYITYVDHSSIRIWESQRAGFYDNHVHSAVEIIMPHSGESCYQLGEEKYCVRQGEILIVPSGCPHSLTEKTDMYRHLILFEPNPLLSLRDMPMIAPLMQRPIYLSGGTFVQNQVSALLMQVIECYNRREPLWNSQCYSYLTQIYACLGRDWLASLSPVNETGHQSIDSPILNSAVSYINERYTDNITLDEVAAFAGFSRYYFSRTFKAFMGLSFTEYLTTRRLNAATELLVRTNQSIQSVAEASGFSSTATFNRVFRNSKKCTPTQYRAIYGAMETQPGGREMARAAED